MMWADQPQLRDLRFASWTLVLLDHYKGARFVD